MYNLMPRCLIAIHNGRNSDESVIGHLLILEVLTHSGVRKGARGEGRGARVSLDYAVRHVYCVHRRATAEMLKVRNIRQPIRLYYCVR
jgi:hypothetical protein